MSGQDPETEGFRTELQTKIKSYNFQQKVKEAFQQMQGQESADYSNIGINNEVKIILSF